MKQLLAPRREARRSKAAALVAIFECGSAVLVSCRLPGTTVRFVVAHAPRYIPLESHGSHSSTARYYGRNDELHLRFDVQGHRCDVEPMSYRRDVSCILG